MRELHFAIKGRARRLRRLGVEDAPAAACRVCGGWTPFGGMSQHSKTKIPMLGRIGCTGPHTRKEA